MTYPNRMAIVVAADSLVGADAVTPIMLKTCQMEREYWARSHKLHYPTKTPLVPQMPTITAKRSTWTKRTFQSAYDGTMARNNLTEGQDRARCVNVIYPPPNGIREFEFVWDERDPLRGFYGPRYYRWTIINVGPTAEDNGYGFGGHAEGGNGTNPDFSASWGEAYRGDDRILTILGVQKNPQWLHLGDITVTDWKIDNATFHERDHAFDDAFAHGLLWDSNGETFGEIGQLVLTPPQFWDGGNMMNMNHSYPLVDATSFLKPDGSGYVECKAGQTVKEIVDANGWSLGSFIWNNNAFNGNRFGLLKTAVGSKVWYPSDASLTAPPMIKEQLDRMLHSNRDFLEPYVETIPEPEPTPEPPPQCVTPISLSQTALSLRYGAVYGLKATECSADVTEPAMWTSSRPDLVSVSEDPTPATDGLLKVLRRPGKWDAMRGKNTATITATYNTKIATCRVTVLR